MRIYIFGIYNLERDSGTASVNLSCERIKNFARGLGRDHGNWHGTSRTLHSHVLDHTMYDHFNNLYYAKRG